VVTLLDELDAEQEAADTGQGPPEGGQEAADIEAGPPRSSDIAGFDS
jgi:hypothetical protein